jgi:hypothetical protein
VSEHPPANWGPGHPNYPHHEAASDHYSVALQHPPRRTPEDVASDFVRGREVMQRSTATRRTIEAQADIAAAHAPAEWRCAKHGPLCRSLEECRAAVDRRFDRELHEDQIADAPTDMEVAMQEVDRKIEDVGRKLRDSEPPRDLDAALSNAALADTPAVREMGGGFVDLRPVRGEVPPLPPGAIVLTGSEAERYRALQAAARKAQESTAAARADGAALLQMFQAFCAGVGAKED